MQSQTTKAKRLVTIEEIASAWLVMFADRKKGQHYTAAQFDKGTKTREEVQQWIASQPQLQLI